MRYLILALVVALPFLATAMTADAGSRCMKLAPLCKPGAAPICICESDYSLKCNWVCGSK